MFSNVRISVRLFSLTALMVTLILSVVGLGQFGLNRIQSQATVIYRDGVVSLSQLSDVLYGLQIIRVRIVAAVGTDDEDTRGRHLAEQARFDGTIDQEWASYQETGLTPAEKTQADDFRAKLAAYRAVKAKVLERIRSGDLPGARAIVETSGGQTFNEATDSLRKLMEMQVAIARDEHDEAERIYADTRFTALLAAGLALVAGIGITLLIVRSITTPIAASIAVMERVARDDTSVEVFGLGRRDEIGDIARTVEVFKRNAIDKKHAEAEAEAARTAAAEERRTTLRRLAEEFEAGVAGVVDDVAAAATEMENTAQSMSALAGQVASQAGAATNASEQAADNVNTVAAATEELSSSVAEIGRQVAESAHIARSAVTEAADTDTIVRGLASAVGRIGEVVGLINDIAAQTNLLALNATIEAARAGEAGKGFAVVAGEVKNLANQTARATEEIAQQIGTVQSETTRAVDAIRNVGATIGRIDGIAAAIASAVEEQSAATREIARNVEQAARGTQEVTSNIGGVTSAADATGTAAGTVLEAARRLAGESGSLRRSVTDFVARVRAG